MFFRLLLSFKTTSFQHILQLTQHVINFRKHSGIFNCSPWSAHFNTHTSSLVARLNTLQHGQHQIKAMGYYLKTPRHDRIKIGSRVRLRLMRHIFRKETIFHSIWTDSVHTVLNIDKKVWPFLYTVDNVKRRFYSFQLLLLSPYFPLNEFTPSRPTKIFIKDFKTINEPYLRSRKIIPSRHEIEYIIVEKNGETKTVSAKDLLLYKKIYGPHILEYSDIFKQPENVQLVI